jgi:hypothetical protein
MKTTPQTILSSPLGRVLVAGALIFSAAAFAQNGGTGSGSGTSDGAAGSQADRDIDAARRGSGTGSSGTGASGTGAAGTGASGTGTGASGDDTADAVERSRQRNLPGARPGDAPSQRPGEGPAAGDSSLSGAIDLDPANGGTPGSRPGAGLGGMPSDGATGAAGTTTGAEETRRDSRTTARMIGETSFAYRDRAMTMVERELAAGNALGSSILRGSSALSGAARTRVDDSVARANAARTELSKAISRARSANEGRWESSRSEVVKRYEDYVKALESAREAAIEGGVRLQDDAGTSATIPAPR